MAGHDGKARSTGIFFEMARDQELRGDRSSYDTNVRYGLPAHGHTA